MFSRKLVLEKEDTRMKKREIVFVDRPMGFHYIFTPVNSHLQRMFSDIPCYTIEKEEGAKMNTNVILPIEITDIILTMAIYNYMSEGKVKSAFSLMTINKYFLKVWYEKFYPCRKKKPSKRLARLGKTMALISRIRIAVEMPSDDVGHMGVISLQASSQFALVYPYDIDTIGHLHLIDSELDVDTIDRSFTIDGKHYSYYATSDKILNTVMCRGDWNRGRFKATDIISPMIGINVTYQCGRGGQIHLSDELASYSWRMVGECVTSMFGKNSMFGVLEEFQDNFISLA